MKAETISIGRVLDAWNVGVEIRDYYLEADGTIVIDYATPGGSHDAAKIKPRWIAGWFGADFVRWEFGADSYPTAMVVERAAR